MSKAKHIDGIDLLNALTGRLHALGDMMGVAGHAERCDAIEPRTMRNLGLWVCEMADEIVS